MQIKKENANLFTLVLARDELTEIKDAIGLRCMYLDAVLRRKRKKDPEAKHPATDKTHEMYIQITKELE